MLSTGQRIQPYYYMLRRYAISTILSSEIAKKVEVAGRGGVPIKVSGAGKASSAKISKKIWRIERIGEDISPSLGQIIAEYGSLAGSLDEGFGTRRNDWTTKLHGFDQRQAKPFKAAREGHQQSTTIERYEAILFNTAKEMYAVGDTKLIGQNPQPIGQLREHTAQNKVLAPASIGKDCHRPQKCFVILVRPIGGGIKNERQVSGQIARQIRLHTGSINLFGKKTAVGNHMKSARISMQAVAKRLSGKLRAGDDGVRPGNRFRNSLAPPGELFGRKMLGIKLVLQVGDVDGHRDRQRAWKKEEQRKEDDVHNSIAENLHRPVGITLAIVLLGSAGGSFDRRGEQARSAIGSRRPIQGAGKQLYDRRLTSALNTSAVGERGPPARRPGLDEATGFESQGA